MGKWPTPHIGTYGGAPVVCDMKTLDLTIDDDNAAGVYTAAFEIPGGSLLLDVGIHAVALWNAGTSALMDIGDATDPNGYFAAINLKATGALAGESINFIGAGSYEGAYYVGTAETTTPDWHWEARWSATTRTISFVLTTVGTVPTTGETVCYVVWANANDDGTVKPPVGTYVAT